MLLEILNCQLWCNLLHRYIVDFFKTKSNIVNYDIVYYIYCAVRIFHREISCAASRSSFTLPSLSQSEADLIRGTYVHTDNVHDTVNHFFSILNVFM